MTALPSSADVIAAHDAALALPPVAVDADDLRGWIAVNHFHNRSLWAQEDLARRTQAPDAEIVANKRAIDVLNQQRNDAVERIDAVLSERLAAAMRGASRQHSETPGMMADRLSILALKCHAMRAETLRADADAAHVARCREKLDILATQRADLARCLDALLEDCLAGRAWFRVYRQFKMYNAVETNPALREA